MSRQTAADTAAATLRELIRTGRLRPGEALREDQLADRLGISRTPLREAIVRLEADGLVVGGPYRSATVFNPSPEDLREIYEIRTALEGLATRLAAPRVTSEELVQLEDLYDRLQETPPGKEWVELNSRLHMAVYQLADRPRLTELIANLRDQSAPYVRLLVMAGHAGEAQKGHRALLDALAEGDADRAAEATARHLADTVRYVLADLEQEEHR